MRDAKALVAYFFPHTALDANDRLFVHLPAEVRAPLVSRWGIRGAKAALRDDDATIKGVVHDAILAGDIDDAIIEEGISPHVLVGWVPLSDWWSFWRSGSVSGEPARAALATARQLQLFDDAWLLDHLAGNNVKLRGIDAICTKLGKDEMVGWLRSIHAHGDGSPAGLVAALGWQTLLLKAPDDALLHALDELAAKVGLVGGPIATSPSAVSQVPPLDESWPEVAEAGDMGFEIAKAPMGEGAPIAKGNYRLDDEEKTFERDAPKV